MARSDPITITLPPFAGAVRQLVLANVGVFFAMALLGLIAPARIADAMLHALWLCPASIASGEIWQPVTYSFMHLGIMDILFAMLMLWMFGAILEGTYGARFLRELYFTSAVGGAVLASIVSYTHVLGLSPDSVAGGAWPAVFGILIALAVRMGDLEIRLWFLINIRMKYLVAITILIDLAVLLKNANAFGALLHLSGALFGYLYVAYAPRRGLAVGFSEQFFGLRNAYYRAKRRRAARKFEVYMGKQGRKVQFDKEGRYLDPDERKDPNDKRWMN